MSETTIGEGVPSDIPSEQQAASVNFCIAISSRKDPSDVVSKNNPMNGSDGHKTTDGVEKHSMGICESESKIPDVPRESDATVSLSANDKNPKLEIIHSQGNREYESDAPPSKMIATPSASSNTSPPVKKSKRQAERMARKLAQDDESDDFDYGYPNKNKKRPAVSSDSKNLKRTGEKEELCTDGAPGTQALLQGVETTPTKTNQKPSTPRAHISPPKTLVSNPNALDTNDADNPLAKSNPLTPKNKATPTQSSTEKKKRTHSNNGVHTRKKRKLKYRAKVASQSEPYRYALDLISLVCNNSYCVSSKIIDQHIQQQPHRVLDKPISGYTIETEPLKERLMRLQLRQRFASAASTRMSPIEFARKLLRLWGGTLEEVFEETSVPEKKVAATKTSAGQEPVISNKMELPFNNETGVVREGAQPGTNGDSKDVLCIGSTGSEVHIERTKKLKKRRKRKQEKDQPTTDGVALERGEKPPDICAKNSVAVTTSAETLESQETTEGILPDGSNPNQKKKPVIKRTARKLIEDKSLPILHKGMRLTHPEDPKHLNALHCFVRSKLLEVYALDITGTSTEANDPQSDIPKASNIVGIRCSQCGHLPKEDRKIGQTMSTFFPKSIGEIYRGVCTWQRIHFPVCQHMPEEFRNQYKICKDRDLTRGRKTHWIKSAFEIGLRNIDSERNGLTYLPDSPMPNLEDSDLILQHQDPGSKRAKKPAMVDTNNMDKFSPTPLEKKRSRTKNVPEPLIQTWRC